MLSMLSLLRLARLGSDVEELRAKRAELVNTVRALADRLADPTLPRMFTDEDFRQPADDKPENQEPGHKGGKHADR